MDMKNRTLKADKIVTLWLRAAERYCPAVENLGVPSKKRFAQVR